MKKRSLFAAVAMLIVSAIVLTSATYAWFAGIDNATVDEFSATVTNSDGAIFLIAKENVLNGEGASNAGIGKAAEPVQQLKASVFDYTNHVFTTEGNFNPFIQALNPVSLYIDSSTDQVVTYKVGYDKTYFTPGGAGVANQTWKQTTPSGGGAAYWEPNTVGDYIHYGFTIKYTASAGSSKYVRLKPTLKQFGTNGANNANFGYVLVRVKPYDVTTGDVASTWMNYFYSNDGNGYTPISNITASNQVTDKKTGTGAIPDVVDPTDTNVAAATLKDAVTVATDDAYLTWDDDNNASTDPVVLKVIPDNLSAAGDYEAEVEVFIWAEGNDADCHGTITSQGVGVSFVVDLAEAA